MKLLSVNVAVLLVIFSLISSSTFANNNLLLRIVDQSGDSLENAVISMFLQNSNQNAAIPAKQIKVIDQVDKEFIAHVLPVQLGTVINFPNHDQIRHHVYSFSVAKKFEIPLYEGMPENPILFNKVGVVALGCNIHDWMSAYIYVVDTPYFTLTDKAGQAALKLPAGEYEIRFWHPNIDKGNGDLTQKIKIEDEGVKTISAQLMIKRAWAFRRGPLSGNNQGRYR